MSLVVKNMHISYQARFNYGLVFPACSHYGVGMVPGKLFILIFQGDLLKDICDWFSLVLLGHFEPGSLLSFLWGLRREL